MASDDSGKKDEKGVTEALKKVFTAGVSAAFMGEEGIRNYLGKMELPKEVLQVLLQSASKSKDEVTQRVTKEIVGIIQKIDFVKEFSKFAETHKFKITAEIDIIKKKDPKEHKDDEKS
jgi:hypothetical protein